MKRLLLFLCTMSLTFALGGVANAIPYTDTYDAGPEGPAGLLMSPWGINEVSWTFDITQDGFDPETQNVTSAEVALNFQDDAFDWWELAQLDVGDNTFLWEVDTGDISFEIMSLISLSEFGTVDAVLTARWGDFYFNSATLTAEGVLTATHAPEPGTIFLFGVGLVGVAAFGRKKLIKT